MDLAQAAAILEDAGWRVELWDTALEPAVDASVIEARVEVKAPDLLIIRPLAHTAHTAVMLGRSAAATSAIRVAMGPSGPHLARELLTPIEGIAAVDGVLIGEPETTLLELLPALADGLPYPLGMKLRELL